MQERDQLVHVLKNLVKTQKLEEINSCGLRLFRLPHGVICFSVEQIRSILNLNDNRDKNRTSGGGLGDRPSSSKLLAERFEGMAKK